MQARARQAALAAGAIALSGAIAEISDRPTVESWSLGTAYSSFLLLALSMVLGPLNVLRRKHNPVHSAVRRDVAITAGIAALVHTVLGLQVHMGGTIMGYFMVPSPGGPTAVAFVTANYVGLLSAAILAVLVSISNNVGVRSLGLPRWKKLQRLAYVAAATALVHGLIYQLLESRQPAIIMLVVAAAAVVVWVQVSGARARRQASPINEQPQTRADPQ